ncbi:RNA polymerase sigma factor [Desulfitobacterium sp. Sab5]|uniref:RNA polymerase sigma factor n=1 Tax=Desulfitobacterium nosdiversum TaxID=3375356 RepID=UPI003CF7FAD3
MFRKKTNKKEVVDYILENYTSFYRLAYSYARNKDDSLDIVQDSILKAISALNKLEGIEHVRTWFYRIVVNTSLDLLRKQKRLKAINDEDLAQLTRVNADNSHLDLERLLDDLPANYRVIVVLRYFEDLKIEDIALILNENVSTVKTRLYTALKKLRIEMQD